MLRRSPPDGGLITRHHRLHFMRTERLPTSQPGQGSVTKLAAVISLGLHLLLGIPLVVGLTWPWDVMRPEQPIYAKIEMIQQDTPTVGDGVSSTGQGRDDAPQAARAPAPPAADAPSPPPPPGRTASAHPEPPPSRPAAFAGYGES